jgi:anthranilate synthase component 2
VERRRQRQMCIRDSSWAVSLNTVSEMKQIALSENNVIMAIQHDSKPIYGVQFHPESVLTPLGKEILRNFIQIVRHA